MMQFIADFFASADFVPHGVCLLWRPDLLIAHGLSDFLIAAAYLTIPFFILRAARSRPDLVHPRVARLFAAFITACALSHWVGLITLWVPAYGVQAIIKLATAGISVYTAIQLATLLPEFLTLPSRADMARREADFAHLRREAEEAREAREKLTEFAYIASHDLKAPMRGLANHARFLLEDCEDQLDESGKRRLHRMQDLCGQLEGMIATLLQYSRIGRSVAREVVQTEDVVDGLCDSLSEMLSERNGQIEIETPLPEVQSNPADVATVFQNLIVNGLTYNDSEHPEIAIGFRSAARVGDRWLRDVFYVRDNGIGIDPDFHDDVFRMFKRLNTPESYGPGAGAGLAFVKKVLDGTGGKITLSSAPGEGTTFWFCFERCETESLQTSEQGAQVA